VSKIAGDFNHAMEGSDVLDVTAHVPVEELIEAFSDPAVPVLVL
jgi:hypothetical protein